jgi:hypothetical protein
MKKVIHENYTLLNFLRGLRKGCILMRKQTNKLDLKRKIRFHEEGAVEILSG